MDHAGKSDHFAEKTFAECKNLTRVEMACPNFKEKTFAGGSETAKSVNVFYLESFPLSGIME